MNVRPTRFVFGFALIWFNIISAPGKSFVCLLRLPERKEFQIFANITKMKLYQTESYHKTTRRRRLCGNLIALTLKEMNLAVRTRLLQHTKR